MKCANCGATLSCGCQKRTTKDGKQVCTKCVHNYEAKKAAPVPKQ
jgi:hypothetical protein